MNLVLKPGEWNKSEGSGTMRKEAGEGFKFGKVKAPEQ